MDEDDEGPEINAFIKTGRQLVRTDFVEEIGSDDITAAAGEDARPALSGLNFPMTCQER